MLIEPPEAACLLLDRSHCCRLAVAIDDAPEAMRDLVDHLVRIVPAVHGVTAVVLTSLRTSGDLSLSAEAELAFIESRERFALAGIDLIDWVLTDGESMVSLAELSDSPSWWREPEASVEGLRYEGVPRGLDS